jgi:hypothetical protein
MQVGPDHDGPGGHAPNKTDVSDAGGYRSDVSKERSATTATSLMKVPYAAHNVCTHASCAASVHHWQKTNKLRSRNKLRKSAAASNRQFSDGTMRIRLMLRLSRLQHQR